MKLIKKVAVKARKLSLNDRQYWTTGFISGFSIASLSLIVTNRLYYGIATAFLLGATFFALSHYGRHLINKSFYGTPEVPKAYDSDPETFLVLKDIDGTLPSTGRETDERKN